MPVWREGDRLAGTNFLPMVYDKLGMPAARHIANDVSGHTLDASALFQRARRPFAEEQRGCWGLATRGVPKR